MGRASRLLQLVQLLDSRRARTLEELTELLGISERSVYRDLGEIEAMGIPLARDGGRYRLAEGASWRPVLLTSRERIMLRLLLSEPALRRNRELRRRLESLENRLAAVIDGGREDFVLAGPDRSGEVDEATLRTIEESIERQQTLAVDYVSLSSGTRRRRVDPWAVFHRSEAWYLVARCHEHGGPRIFRLDRVKRARMTDDLFLRPADFHLETWLADSWSLYQGDAVREIVVRFAAEVAPLVEHGAHHEGEQIRKLESGDVEYRVRLAHVEEVARWIVTFGGRARAIEPPELVARVREIAGGVTAAHAAEKDRPSRPPKSLAAKTARRSR